MTFASRWAAMRASLMFHKLVRDKVARQCPQTTTFEAQKGEPKQIRTEVPFMLTARPNRLTVRGTGLDRLIPLFSARCV